jgi:hypothetical protein
MASCVKDKSHLEDEKLSSLIADLHISELSLKRHDEEIRDSLKELYLDYICKIHKVSREEIKYEIELLNEDRSRQSDVYTITIDRLQELERKFKVKIDPKVAK